MFANKWESHINFRNIVGLIMKEIILRKKKLLLTQCSIFLHYKKSPFIPNEGALFFLLLFFFLKIKGHFANGPLPNYPWVIVQQSELRVKEIFDWFTASIIKSNLP